MSVWMLLLLTPISLLLTALFVPNGWFNRHLTAARRVITQLAALECMGALLLAILYVAGSLQPVYAKLFVLGSLSASIYYDGAACLMLSLVSFVGWVICRYSIRYLDGDPNQGRYFRWIAVTIGAVSSVVVSGNLLQYVAAWILTSYGLHHLLLHFPERPAAQRAAWTKFLISRLGDAVLIGALVCAYLEFGTLEFPSMFALAAQTTANGTGTPLGLQLVGWLLVVGAITKSAQVPFHTWLPQTLETPTPVSALMHAGIVNAGGYLILRSAPLITVTPTALAALAVVGAVTACYGAIVGLTQPSVKRSLAYSTIAQMGFMMLQCGLGAFSAAMLHIVAHSLYKAHAFLSSGNVLAEKSATRGGVLASTARQELPTLGLAAAVAFAWYLAAMFSCGIHPTSEPGGYLLGAIFVLALSLWLGRVMMTRDLRLIMGCVCSVGVLSFAYSISFAFVDRVLVPTNHFATSAWWSAATTAAVIVGFGFLFAVQTLLTAHDTPKWMRAAYVHAMNGFYFETLFRRSIGKLASN